MVIERTYQTEDYRRWVGRSSVETGRNPFGEKMMVCVRKRCLTVVIR